MFSFPYSTFASKKLILIERVGGYRMKIAIVVNSITGNTLLVAEKLKEKFQTMNNEVEIKRIAPTCKEPVSGSDLKNIVLKDIPELSPYDLIILAGPVHAFSISAVIKEYVKQSQTLKGKNVMIYVTHAFPFNWLGGNHAISQLKSECESKGANVIKTGIVSWANNKREAGIEKLLKGFTDR
ncbi:flavodoxin family protein [Tissierella creatinini]|nr:flavodoxin family protein [Tissierella creatinini]TJX60079.1 flavodoxin family protein [Soehngenia saccharolytica]